MRILSLLTPLALATVALAGCTGSTPSPGNEVTGLSEHFQNGDLTVAVGEAVTFRIKQGAHTVDFAENGAPANGVSNAHSGNLASGSTFGVTFTEPGTYPYFCQYHSFLQGGQRSGMVGTIAVTAA